MAKTEAPIDVLVLGEHPAAYLAAALLRVKSKYRIAHACVPERRLQDRLVLINPDLYDLHPLLEGLKKKLPARSIYGVQFLSDDSSTRSEYRNKSAINCVAHLKDVRDVMERLADEQGVELLRPRNLQIHRLDEQGVEITIGAQPIKPRALILAEELSEAQRRTLGIPEDWEQGVLHRYTYLRVRNSQRLLEISPRPLMPMSLDLAGQLSWAWLLPCERAVQLCVEQPLETVQQHPPAKLLAHWAQVLQKHGVFKSPLEIEHEQIESLDLPFAGALAHEGVANRTLLIGPAGGFYSASGEDVYPNCWSAVHAAEVMKKALKETHLQDALQPYRQKWRTTLGNYLRGPQQNLRFLLPLVYRNQIMTNRLAEAILMGKSVVR